MKSIPGFYALALSLLFTPALFAQSAYKGLYTGLLYMEAPQWGEQPLGPIILTIDEEGYIFGKFHDDYWANGQVDANGDISWDYNPYGFTNGQIDHDGRLTATNNSQPWPWPFRFEAQNQASGFGRNADAVAYKFEWLSPQPVSGDFHDVDYGGGDFVAVGEGGIAAHSNNGFFWLSLGIPASVDLNGVAYGNGVWVVGGDENTAFISTDLVEWTPVVIGGVNVNDIEFANGVFYATTLNGGIMSSTYGVSWTQVHAAINTNIRSIQYLNGLYVAQQKSTFGAGGLLLSTNGTDWTVINLGNGDPGRAAYGNGMWVFPFTRKIYRFSETDASDLTSINTSHNSNAMGFIDGAFIDGDFYVSTNAVDWTQANTYNFEASKNEQNAFATDGAVLIGVGESIVWTPDAVSFSLRSSRPLDTTLRLFNIVQGGGMWLLTGDNVSAATHNLANWTEQSGPSYGNATYGQGRWIAKVPGAIYESEDGLNWENVGSSDYYNWEAIAYGNGMWVASSQGTQTLYHSTNGVDWTAGQSFDGHQLFDIEYVGDNFIAVGTTSFLSSDGVTWTGGAGGTGARMEDVDYADGLYVAVGRTNTTSLADGRLVTSADGLNWTNRTPGAIEALFGVRHAAGTWVAVGANDPGDHGATVLESTNGIDWEVAYANFDGDLFGLEAANGQMIAVGDRGTVLSIPYADLDSPYFKQQPQSQSVIQGSPHTLTVNYGGIGPFEFRWMKDNEPLQDGNGFSGASTDKLSFADVQLSDYGQYTLLISNAHGARLSNVAIILIDAPQSFEDFVTGMPVDHQGPMDLNPTAGMPNLFAYAFDAADGDRSKLPRQSVATAAELGLGGNETYLVIEYRQRDVADISITARAGGTLDALSSGAGQVVRVGEPVEDGGGVWHQFRSLQSIEAADELFMQLVISLGQPAS